MIEVAGALPRRMVDPKLAALLRTTDAAAPLVVRLTLGAVMFPHGAQKLLGWFGGYGFSGTMGFFTGTMHVPAPLAFLVIMAESFGALLLLAGAFTRVAAAGIGAVMLGAIALTHAPHGFFMNWFGNQAGEGFEYHLLVLGMAAALVIAGGGRASVDRAIAPEA
ncbi:MAG: DoxX family protein [Minicystis sp.]